MFPPYSARENEVSAKFLKPIVPEMYKGEAEADAFDHEKFSDQV